MRLTWVIALVAPTLAAASADELAGAMRELGASISAGELGKALARTRALEEELATAAPLAVSDGQLLRAPAEGLGIYQAAPGGTLDGDEIYLYAAVRNHGLRRVGKAYELHLVSDLLVLDDHGVELARDLAFGESRFVAREPHRDTFVNIAVRAKGLSTGSYVMRLIIHDRVSGKSGQTDIRVRVP